MGGQQGHQERRLRQKTSRSLFLNVGAVSLEKQVSISLVNVGRTGVRLVQVLLLSTSWVPGSARGPGDPAVSKADVTLDLTELVI